ncbi:MAG: hypothetical protein JNK15_07730 [Planctomycetes bacterium]|nr:hypothetical protein [Planctomycetota bacterium]
MSPTHFANAEGPANNFYPFGSTVAPFRYSQIHDDVPAMVISGMSFRHNWNANVYAVHSITMDAWVSTAATASAAMSSTFDTNHGVDKTQVVFNRTYTLANSDPSNLPGAFVLDYPFDVPFVFPGGGASLCWEVHVTAKTQTGSVFYDAVSASSSTTSGPANPAVAIGRFGTGCTATGMATPMTATATQSTNWLGPTMTLTVNGTNLVPNGLNLFCMGVDKTSYLGIPLPAVLPGTTCPVYSDIVLATPIVASAGGAGSNALTFVPAAAYHGVTIYSQVWGLDAAANAFGLVTSNAAMHHIVAPYTTPLPVSRLFLSGSLGATGTVGTSYGLVTNFY